MKQIAPHQIRHSHIVRVGGENVWDDTPPTHEHVFTVGEETVYIETAKEIPAVFSELRVTIMLPLRGVYDAVGIDNETS